MKLSKLNGPGTAQSIKSLLRKLWLPQRIPQDWLFINLNLVNLWEEGKSHDVKEYYINSFKYKLCTYAFSDGFGFVICMFGYYTIVFQKLSD